MPLQSDRDWEAEQDLDALMRADDVQKDPARLQRIQSHLEEKREAIDNALTRITPAAKNFNGATRSKRNA